MRAGNELDCGLGRDCTGAPDGIEIGLMLLPTLEDLMITLQVERHQKNAKRHVQQIQTITYPQ